MEESKILIAIVISAHGVKGEFKIKSYADHYKNFKDYKSLENEKGQKYHITHASVISNKVILKFDGIDDRNTAESLIGLKLYLNKSDLKNVKNDEFYHFQIIGADVHDLNHNKIGLVKAIHNFGAGEIIEIKKNDGSTEFFSFTKEVVTKIDLIKNYIVLNPMEEI